MKTQKIALTLFFLLLCNLALSAVIPASERQALIDLYNSTNGDSWTIKTGWKTAPLHTDGFAMPGTENTWYGISTDVGNTTVQNISLGWPTAPTGNNLIGPLPGSLGNLINLSNLLLDNNKISGSIPASLGNLINLTTLTLNANQLSGSIPLELGNLSKLQILYLFSNQLTGNIPSSLGNLSNLLYLSLYSNNLSGTIPMELGNLSHLSDLRLNSNKLTGNIPSNIGNLINLQSLYFHSNQLTGSIPTELGNLINLRYLTLGSNQLTGSIPTGFGNLSELKILSLCPNQLIGSIPVGLGNLSNLQELGLGSNQLTGNIPTEFGNLSNLISLSLSSNRLSGSIPTSLTSLTKLNSSWTNIGYNALYTLNAGLIAFLNSKESNWAATQTIAPTGVSAVPGISSVTVSWTPITYTSNSGGYRVLIATSPGGPYTFYAQTANKIMSSQQVTGLTPGIPYYFVVQTRTDANANNPNVVNSDISEEVWTTPLVPPTITVTSPNGGESWIAGSAHNITWTSTGTIANVKLEYSMNAGTNWTTIITSTANAGEYLWTLPATTYSSCLVRISEATTGTPTDSSNVVFSIVPSISGTVTSGGTALPNVVMSGLPGNPTTDSQGKYSSIIPYQWSGTVTPTLAGYSFTPASRAYSNITGNQVDQYYLDAAKTHIPALERAALIDFYNSTNGDSWVNNTGWKMAPLYTDGFAMPGTEKIWSGVTTNSDNMTVVKLDYSFRNLNGTLPASLGNLSSLLQLRLEFNQLTGSLPPSLGNLTKLQYLCLQYNRLSGSIPAELGNPLMSGICNIFLCNNQLTGNIPVELGNLGNLQILELGDNHLSGSIPASLSNLRFLKSLNLASNQLSGSIPEELGNLSNLGLLRLSSNKLSGSIPISLAKLGLQLSGGLNIQYNALYTSNLELIVYLNSRDTDWAVNQTVAPAGVSAVPGSSSVTVSWTPITYKSATGGYRVFYSTVASGPYTFYAQTANKSVSSQLVTGLTPGIPYYFVVQTRTDAHAANQNVVDSENSEEVWATPLIPPTITVTSPNGGESWISGSTQNITWTTTGTVANVKLEYSTNDGTTWTTIIASTTNTGTFPWTVPAVVSANCLVRVSEAANGTQTDVSNAIFAITAGVPTIGLSKTSFNFGTERHGTPTPSEAVILTNTGIGILSWTATPSADWISVSPGSGTGAGVMSIRISRTDMSPGFYTGTIEITDPNASNSPQTINVGLDVIPVGNDSPPFGNYATPDDGATVASSIPVTGWVLDDVGIQSVKIYRGTGLSDRVYIGDSVFSKGSRPDVETAYPGYPQNDRAGWGYMLLTNFLPNGGNGTFTLLAYAKDTAGHEVLLGDKTITCDNLHAVKPFGAIDTPSQGGTASGSAYVNFGWALTPQPKNIPVNGSTITVWIDGLPLGHPVYNNPRADIAALFPGYANTNGAVGYYYLNTTGFENRVHTIAWSVADSAGAADGIGSRYFTIQNVAPGSRVIGSEAIAESPISFQNQSLRSISEIAGILEDGRMPVYVKRGFRDDQTAETVFPETDGTIRIKIPEVSRVVVYLNETEIRRTSRYEAYELVLGELRPLPIGASFDSREGVFYWQPGPGFLGDFNFVFVDGTQNTKKVVNIRIGTK